MGEGSVKIYVSCLAVFALALTGSWAYWYGLDPGRDLIISAFVFGLLLCLVRLFPIDVSKRWSIDASDVVFVGAIVMMGPTWATLAALPYGVLISKGNVLRIVYEVAQNTIMLHMAALVFAVASQPLLIEAPGSLAPVVFAAFASTIAFVVSNNAVGAGLLRIKYSQPFKQTWQEQIEPFLLSDVINVLTSGVGVLALLVYGPVAAIIAVAGSIASQVIVYRSRDKVAENLELKARVASLEESLAASNLSFGTMVISDLGRRDGYMHLHAAATSVFSADIAREMDFDPHRQALVGMSGLLHNIGMFGLPDDLLTTTNDLNSIALRNIEEHPVRGEAALNAVPEFEEMARWVRWHHERPDGRGYPDRLRAAWIPLEARILAVAQAYASMVLDQPRRRKMDFVSARSELNDNIGTQFDEVVVRAFLRILDTESEGYRMADDYRFAFPPQIRNLDSAHQKEVPAEIPRRDDPYESSP